MTDIEVVVDETVIDVEVTDTVIEVEISGGVGPQGPTGPQGPAGTAGGSRHEESFTAATVVVVDHNFGYEPLVSVIIAGEEQDADVTHSTVNQLTVTFGQPSTGKVVCI